MKIFCKMLQLKSNKSELEKGAYEAISSSYDNSKKEYIKPMISYLKELIGNN